MIRALFQGDHVRYTGGKTFLDDDGELLNINGSIGEVIGHVANTSELVVDFKGYSFVIHPNNLKRQSFSGDDEHHLRQIERKWKVSDDDKGSKKRNKNQEAK
jgi:hypothetical protein